MRKGHPPANTTPACLVFGGLKEPRCPRDPDSIPKPHRTQPQGRAVCHPTLRAGPNTLQAFTQTNSAHRGALPQSKFTAPHVAGHPAQPRPSLPRPPAPAASANLSPRPRGTTCPAQLTELEREKRSEESSWVTAPSSSGDGRDSDSSWLRSGQRYLRIFYK